MSFTSINDISPSFVEIQEQTAEIIRMLADQLKDQAHAEGDMDWLRHLAKTIDQVKAVQKSLLENERVLIDVLKNTLGFENDQFEVSTSGLRTITVEVSQGMINQHLLSLTHARNLGKVALGEKFEITLPDGSCFTTDLCDPGNKLRERGRIRHFYETSKISDGKEVVLEETSHGKWLLKPRYAPGEWERIVEETLRAESGSRPNTSAAAMAEAPSPTPVMPAGSGNAPVEIIAEIDWTPSSPEAPKTP